jgi:HK97 gp10 family phage protein
MMYGALDLEFGVRNTAGLAANFHAADRDVQDAMREIMDRGADLIVDITKQLVPRDTGFMGDHVAKRRVAGGLGYEVGWDASDFIAAGLAFYPVFVELGTRMMAAQPSLGPAYNYATPIIQQDARAILRRAIERIGRRGTTAR